LENVWRKRKNSFFKPKSLLIYDSAPSHLTDEVKTKVKTYSELAVIPGGLTKLLQALDISVNKSFKSKIRKNWEKWMISGYHEFTKWGKIKRASYAEVCRWIETSWSEITPECIKKGFRKSKVDCYDSVEVFEEDNDVDSDSTDVDIPSELKELIEKDDISSDEDFDGFN
jgi:hypothetical protein